MNLHRMRIRLTKERPLQFISHLDYHRALERTVRRAGLPAAYSQGYHPKPRMTLASALAVGATSEGEYADLFFTAPLEPDQLQQRLNEAAPPGMRVLQAAVVQAAQPALMAVVTGAYYRLCLRLAPSPCSLAPAVDELVSQPAIVVKRQNRRGVRHVDIAPLIYELKVVGQEAERAWLELFCAAGERGNVKPHEVLEQLAYPIADAAVHRLDLVQGTGKEQGSAACSLMCFGKGKGGA